MAKTAIVNKETGVVIGTTTGSAELNKMVIEAAGLTNEQVDLVTAKSFKPSEAYPTFKDMTITQEERDAAAKKAADKATADAQKAEDKKAKEAAKAEKAASKGTRAPRGNATALEGDYYVAKSFPATPADHPKMPIWEAIAKNTSVDAAKAACPEVNPPRKTNGVYTFNSEFRYLLNTGYVGMGQRPEPAAEGAEGSTAGEGAEAGANAAA